MTNFLSPFFFVSSSLTLLLGIGVLRVNPRNFIYQAWFYFCFSVGLWSLGLGLLTVTTKYQYVPLFYFLHYLGAINIPLAFLFFVRSYFVKSSKPELAEFTIPFALAIGQIGLLFTDKLIAPPSPKWQFTYYTNPGEFYWFFVGYFFLMVLYCFWIMFFATIKAIGKEKIRFIFFLVATAIGYTSGSSAFLLVYDVKLPPYGIVFFLLFPILTTYAIFRHGLLDIEVIIKRSLVFAGLFGFLMVIASNTLSFLQYLLGGTQYSPFMTLGLTLTAVMLLYEPSKKY